MLKRANVQFSGKTLYNQIEKGNVSFDWSIQRRLVWNLEKKSMLINSMIENYPIPPFYFEKSETGYDAIDGKQRSNAIHGYINNEYALFDEFPVIVDEEGNEYECGGLKFNELPEVLQDKIKDYSLTIYYFENLTDEEKVEMFDRINSGQPLTAIELIRVKAKSINQFQKIAEHELINEIVTEKSKEKYNHENLVMQMWGICFIENPEFATKTFRPLIKDAIVTEEQIQILNQSMDYVSFAISELDSEDKEQKRILTKIKRKSHIVSCIYFAKKSIELEITKERYFEAIYKFFNTTKTSINDNYNNACGGGNANRDKVQKRMEAMDALVGYAQRYIEKSPKPIIHTDFDDDFEKEEAV